VSDETVKDGVNLLKDLLSGDDNKNNNNNNYDQDNNNAYRKYERERKKLGLNRSYNDNSTEWTDGAENNNQPTERMETTTTTTKAEIAEATGVGYKVPAAERASNKAKKATCDVGGLNSEFKKYGVYGYE
jgi:hypothetical protein